MSALLWKTLRSRWKATAGVRAAGYCALLPVPADLPVFLKIAMGTVNAQASDGLVETLVIPDRPTRSFQSAFEAAQSNWTNGPIRLVTLRPTERFITSHITSPHINHWLQIVNGLDACTATHALLHDADLFITDPNFLKSHYAAIVGKDLACVGVNPVWDDWYMQNNLGHVLATWELIFNVEWARSFKPWLHRGHHGTINGKAHEFDTMLLPQCLTEPARIQKRRGNWGFVHFNYVICTYRWFQENERRGRAAYIDEHWRILLIRLLVDAYESTESEADVPVLSDLRDGLAGKSRRVNYTGKSAAEHYPEFRGKLEQLLTSGVLDESKAASIRRGIAPFDAAVLTSE